MNTIEFMRVQGNYGLEAKDENGNIVHIDNSQDHGGENFGVRPMQLLLMGLGGCSAMDVISILNKQRQEIKAYKMIVKGEREEGKIPTLWKSAIIEFHLYGNIDEQKAQRAVDLSMNKYCSVSETLRRSGTELKWEVFVNKKL